jgi:acyl dehydratase
MASIAPLYLDDLAVGQTFRSGSVVVDLDRIKTFAAEFDPQPFHTDEAAAVGTIFGGLVASGWHTAALTMRMLVESDFRIAGGLVGLGVEQIRWPLPVRPADVLHVESEILEVRPSQSNSNRGVVKVRNTTLNQDGQTVMVQVANLIVPRKPGQEPTTSNRTSS